MLFIKYPDYQCSMCGYIPDDDDFKYTDYELDKCATCGQENVCDLCLMYDFEELEKEPEYMISHCVKCNNKKPNGHLRKEFLKDEYPKEVRYE